MSAAAEEALADFGFFWPLGGNRKSCKHNIDNHCKVAVVNILAKSYQSSRFKYLINTEQHQHGAK